MVTLIRFTRLVRSSVRKLDAWRTNASNTVSFHGMGNLWVGHGIRKNHSISSGNNGTAAVTVDITVCLLGKRREEKLVTSLSSIMGNGHSTVFIEYRNLLLLLSLLSILSYNFMVGCPFSS